MNDPEKPSPLDGLGKRIKAARERREDREGSGRQSRSYSGLGLGLRITTEMVSALAVGVGIGLVLDTWLGTQPWFLIVFFVLGAAAAFVNLIRVANQVDAARRRDEEGAERRDDGA
ncbi:AtpZ/AtpI family protein [Ferruginivarius sediminum]|nr:AtpZ/AtpI family protein [Ferruginivarius sediminum]